MKKLYPNWPVIAEYRHRNAGLTLLFATLDLHSPLARLIAERLPEFLSEKPTTPVPLSAIRESVRRYYISNKIGDCSEKYLRWYIRHCAYMAPIRDNFPTVNFAVDELGLRGIPDARLVPPEIKRNLPVGAVVEWEGTKWVTLSTVRAGELVIAPLACVDPDN